MTDQLEQSRLRSPGVKAAERSGLQRRARARSSAVIPTKVGSFRGGDVRGARGSPLLPQDADDVLLFKSNEPGDLGAVSGVKEVSAMTNPIFRRTIPNGCACTHQPIWFLAMYDIVFP
jgi:hypothetical protein